MKPAIASGLVCWNMFGGGASKSNTSSQDNRVAASEGSLAVGGGGTFHEQTGGVAGNASNIGSTNVSGSTLTSKTTSASEGSLALGENANFQEGGIGSANKIGSTEVGSGSTITVTDTSADVLNKALDKYAELASGFGSSLNQFVGQQEAGQAGQLSTILASVDAAKSSQDTTTQNQKLFLYIVLAVLALLGVMAWRRK